VLLRRTAGGSSCLGGRASEYLPEPAERRKLGANQKKFRLAIGPRDRFEADPTRDVLGRGFKSRSRLNPDVVAKVPARQRGMGTKLGHRPHTSAGKVELRGDAPSPSRSNSSPKPDRSFARTEQSINAPATGMGRMAPSSRTGTAADATLTPPGAQGLPRHLAPLVLGRSAVFPAFPRFPRPTGQPAKELGSLDPQSGACSCSMRHDLADHVFGGQRHLALDVSAACRKGLGGT
jgi:hypothetical protein